MRYRFLLLILIYPLISSGQQKIIDSLEVLVHTKNLADKRKIIPLSELAIYYKSDTLRSLQTAQRAINLATKQQDQQFCVYAYSSLALTYALQGQVDQAYIEMDNTTKYIHKTTVKRAKATAYHQIGLSKFYLSDRDGLKDIYISLQLLGKTDYKLKSLNYSVLTNYYLADISQADKYSNLAIENGFKSKDYHSICYAWNIRGVRFLSEFEKTQNAQVLDSALVCLKKALSIYDDHPGYIRTSSGINIIANLMYIYQSKQEIEPDVTNLEAVRLYLAKTLLLPTEQSDEFLINRYMIRIKAEIIQKNQLEAESLFLEAIAWLDQRPKNYRNKYELHQQLAQFYDKTGRFEDSNKHLNEAFKYYQNYYDDRYIKIGQQQLAKFELSKKELELEEKQNLLYIGFTAFAIFILLIILYIRHFIKHKRQEIALLSEIKDQEAQAKIDAELIAKLKSEETRRLQKEIIAKKIQVSHKNEILLNLRQNLQNNVPINTRQFEKILKYETLLDRKFDGFEQLVQRIHPDFYIRLQECASNKLTTLDLKYCAYIFIKMPTKEMADLLYVELKTIRMTKYRLKIKLKLQKDVDLEDFIQNIV
ncbi:hypothetical protein [Flavobacterium sp. HSC-61S13]|uniref:hypothetical protein n=1 Tax=Flavobacterium sp. HSC-61S13 TaxID=2910963 RepID=UPI0020A1D20A|nr:hypothetical protein [Flavobacterium sp. HSC-61S13]MCP1994259.1 hypothetical protein [Flavobacterium sp. HSC-61S13]